MYQVISAFPGVIAISLQSCRTFHPGGHLDYPGHGWFDVHQNSTSESWHVWAISQTPVHQHLSGDETVTSRLRISLSRLYHVALKNTTLLCAEIDNALRRAGRNDSTMVKYLLYLLSTQQLAQCWFALINARRHTHSISLWLLRVLQQRKRNDVVWAAPSQSHPLQDEKGSGHGVWRGAGSFEATTGSWPSKTSKTES